MVSAVMVTHKLEENTAELILAKQMDATMRARVSRSTALDPWVQNASKTWDRIKAPVLQASMVDSVRLFVTAQLAYRSIAIPGDFVETGVAQGGASILMMAVLDDAAAWPSFTRARTCIDFDKL